MGRNCASLYKGPAGRQYDCAAPDEARYRQCAERALWSSL
jgi:hypothetical protein